MSSFSLRPLLLALSLLSSSALLAGNPSVSPTKVPIPFSALVGIGYPDPSSDYRSRFRAEVRMQLIAGGASEARATELEHSPALQKMWEMLGDNEITQGECFRRQVDLLNENTALGEVEEGSAGAARRTEILAELERLEAAIEAILRGNGVTLGKTVHTLRTLQASADAALASLGDEQGPKRTKVEALAREVRQRAELVEKFLGMTMRTVEEAPWQDWRDGFGFAEPPSGVAMYLPGEPPLPPPSDPVLLMIPRDLGSEPALLSRIRILRTLREQQDSVGVITTGMRAKAAQEALEEKAAALERAQTAAERDSRRRERARLTAEARELKEEAFARCVRDLEGDAKRGQAAEEAAAREKQREDDLKREAAETRKAWREFAKAAPAGSGAAVAPVPAEAHAAPAPGPLPVVWHDEARSHDFHKKVSDPATREMIEASVTMLRSDGPVRIGAPVAGAPGLFELRPGGGQTTWRPLYVRHGDRFVIIALAKESVENPAGFKAGVMLAMRRAAALPPPA